MENLLIEESKEILKQLSPENQAYFMTLVKVAEVAEANVKKHMKKRIEKDPEEK